ncbi:MAG: LexA family transcriptional regulator [Clostridiaceae bacterium]|nr:LexA family transcriptional regulator [Clostridiaceae bacterium]
MSRISDNIKKARLDIGMNQKQLAKKLGVSESFVNEIETGRRVLNESTINRIANVLKINLNDINMYDEDPKEEKIKEVIPVKKENKKNEPINELWNDAFGSVIRNVPVFNYELTKALDTKPMPIISNKINGFSQDKVAFLKIEDDDMIGYRICKGDIAFINLSHEIENSSICLIEYNCEKIIRQIKKLDASKILLIKNSGTLKTQTVSPKEIKVLARLISVEVLLKD